MGRTLRFAIGVAGLLVVLVAGSVAYILSRQSAQVPFVTLTCIGGSEKSELMADQSLQQILHDTYRLAVNFRSMGSLEQAKLSTDELKKQQIDCLWPSSNSALLVFNARHATGDFPAYRAETVLSSPEVVYAGPDGTAALTRAGIVQQRNNRFFIVKLKDLLLQYVLAHKEWPALGAQTLQGPITMGSTDPTQSNSGFTLYLLILNIVATNNVYQPPTPAQARAALSTVRQLYEAQGLQATSSGFGFDQWLLEGGELSSGLYAGYESQIIAKAVQNAGQAATLLKSVRILYPEPTVYNEHPILALDKDAQRLIDAMKDPKIQKLAWQRYGFRPVLLGQLDVKDFPDIPLAEQLRTTHLPNAQSILMLDNCLKNNVCH